jgi:hypothetical protein
MAIGIAEAIAAGGLILRAPSPFTACAYENLNAD